MSKGLDKGQRHFLIMEPSSTFTGDHSSDSVPVVFGWVWSTTISAYIILIARLLGRVIYIYDENIPVVMLNCSMVDLCVAHFCITMTNLFNY